MRSGTELKMQVLSFPRKALKAFLLAILPKEIAEELRHYTLFVVRTRRSGYCIADEPYFDETSRLFFRERLAETSNYLEFGGGGSTLWAWQIAKTVVTVESDRGFLIALERRLAALPTRPAFARLVHVHLGLTGEWGIPVFKKPTVARLKRWERYAKAPWAVLAASAIEPDTILIDGRFRVACALVSLISLPPQSQCSILVDDYLVREHYRDIATVAELTAMQGRMAVFRKPAHLDTEKCLSLLASYRRDWR